MVRSGKGLTTPMDLSTKSPNKKQRARTSSTDITNQYFRNVIKEFNNPPYLGYKKKQVHNEQTEAYVFPIKQIPKPIKSNKHVRICTKGFQSDVDRKKRVNKILDMSTQKKII